MEAIILAGGRGERLWPETADRPKAMVELAGRPLLAHQIEWLRGFGVDRAVISCGPRWEVIRDHFGERPESGFEIAYGVEERALGRGGGIKWAMGWLRDRSSPFYVTNGDTLCDCDLGSMLRRHREVGAVATVLLVPYQSSYGIVEVSDSGLVAAFREKPVLPYWLNAGVYVMDPGIRDLLPEVGDHEATTFPRLAGEGRLAAFQARCYWRPIDTMKDLTEARAHLAGDRANSLPGE